MGRPKDATSDHRINFTVLAISSGIAIVFFVARGAPADTDDEWESGAYGLSIASLVFLGVMILLHRIGVEFLPSWSPPSTPAAARVAMHPMLER